MSDKVLTISVAAYNVEKTIRQTLDCLAVPEILDLLEVFVVDDGGTDGALEIAQGYEQQYPGTFHAVHKENGGYGSTVNYSILHASGRYFRPLDGDDWLDSDSLTGLLRQLAAIDVDMVISPFVKYGEQTRKRIIIDGCAAYPQGSYSFEQITASKHLAMHGLTYRTELLRTIGLHLTEHCFYTDAEYAYLPLPYVKTVYVWKQPLYFYRVEAAGQSVSLSGKRKHYLEHETVFQTVADAYRKADVRENPAGARALRDAAAVLAGWHIELICIMERRRERYRELRDFCGHIKRDLPELVPDGTRGSKAAAFICRTPWLYPLWNWLCIWKLKRWQDGE